LGYPGVMVPQKSPKSMDDLFQQMPWNGLK
jgi:hypothetical protein